jgi:hypothetical protein
MSRLPTVALALLVFGIAFDPAWAQSSWISKDTTKTEEKLAVINADRLVRTDDVTVARFRFLISALSDASGEPPMEVGDKLVTSRRLLRDKFGKDVSLLSFTEGAYQARSGITKGRLTEYLSRLLLVSARAAHTNCPLQEIRRDIVSYLHLQRRQKNMGFEMIAYRRDLGRSCQSHTSASSPP